MPWFTDSHFAFCRGIANHAWRFPPEMEYSGRQLIVTLTCGNCGSKRKDQVSQFNGEIASRSYDYPDGYLLDLQGKHRPPKHRLRRDGLELLLHEFRAKQSPKPALTKRNGRRRAVA